MRDAVSTNAGRVTVAVPARLHLGFLDLDGGLGRRFGGIGLAVSGPATRLAIERAARDRVSGAEGERAAAHLSAMTAALGLGAGWHVHVEEAVPPHVGLGSGTQIALAVAAGLRRLAGLAADPKGDAVRLGRGARSGIGIALFERGGFVVDGGRGPATAVAPVIARLAFPEAWRVIMVLDRRRQGIHGAAERASFAALPPFPAAAAGRLCRLLVMGALPALAEGDLPAFGGAVGAIQAYLGDYFAPIQGGGRFTSPDVGRVLWSLAREGAHGIGQSSWGPTGFAFAGSPAEAERLAEAARRHPDAGDLDIRVGRGLNRGAEIATCPAAAAAAEG